MKKKKLLPFLVISLLLTLCCVLLFSSCEAEENKKVTLYVYNWGEYISDGSDGSLDVNRAFEEYCRKELGLNVEVNYSTFSSNESMYAKIKSGSANYDVIVPSDYMIERMVGDDLLMPLELDRLENYQYIDDAFKGENVYYEGDSENSYSVPYFYGMVGVIYNTAIVEENDSQIGSWDLMWDPSYKGNILQFNNSRDAFGTALYKLGYDVNDYNEERWREALDELLSQKEIVQGYVMDEIFNKMKSGSAAIAAYYAGDYLSMYEENGDLAFFYPEEGTNIYVDAMCIPKSSQNYELAMEYIDFMCRKDIAIENALYTYYASPLTTVVNDEGYQEAMAEVHEDAIDILYGEKAKSVPTQAYLNLSPEGIRGLNILWEELKAKSSIGNGIYIGCGVILGVLAVFCVFHVLKKRRWAKLYD
ncbi:MAG: spermidine/putrescine ABC transporter substrate-binding protein [Ruminococcaceae bacterium]|nr:spermidine/putrescine ABC transporter substrate-binding protein [Oscillospiraceae bacterium]